MQTYVNTTLKYKSIILFFTFISYLLITNPCSPFTASFDQRPPRESLSTSSDCWTLIRESSLLLLLRLAMHSGMKSHPDLGYLESGIYTPAVSSNMICTLTLQASGSWSNFRLKSKFQSVLKWLFNYYNLAIEICN